MGRTPSVVVAIVGSLMCSLTGAAQAQWTWRAVDLHPPNSYRSEAYGVSRAGIGGSTWDVGATLWLGRGTPWTDLTPEQFINGVVNGAGEIRQGGSVHNGYAEVRAMLWRGTQRSATNMHPGGTYTGSEINDVCGDIAVGRLGTGGTLHAAMWTVDEPDSIVDLHPPFAISDSNARATDGLWQAGSTWVPDIGATSAILWKGTAESAIVMHPPHAKNSGIHGMAVGIQVGDCLLWDPRDDHAFLWHDTPESWIDMHPSFHPLRDSYMLATTGDMHVGKSNAHAGIWFGDDPDSFFDLHQFVPGSPTVSGAEDIDIYNGNIYIAGYAVFIRPHAIVWIGTPVDGAAGDDAETRTPQSVKKRP